MKNYPACKDQWQTPQQWHPLWVSFSQKLPNSCNFYGSASKANSPTVASSMGQLQWRTPQQLHPLWSLIPLLVVSQNLDIKSILFHVHCHISQQSPYWLLPLNQLVSSKRTVQTLQVGMCVQRRFKSVCPATQSEETLDPLLPIEHLSNVQADQSSMGPHVNSYLLLCTGSYGIEMPGFETVDML